MKRLEGPTRKWVALAGVLVLAATAWFTMENGSSGANAAGSEAVKLGWFVLDAGRIRLGAVLIILSFGLRIVLMDRLSGTSGVNGAGEPGPQQDETDAAALQAAAEVDVEK